MTRHAAYALTSRGYPKRYPFATFPHADAARRWLANHPDTPVRFVPALPATGAEIAAAIDRATSADDTLGACGCTDYHMADCPTRTGGAYGSAGDVWAAMERRHARGDDDLW